MQEKFEEWNPPVLPKNYSDSANTLLKKYLIFPKEVISMTEMVNF